ncbi:S1C family serine protease [Reinekea blandensis]|uniref:Peptidase S1 and S6, chymotrypsin/Hap n=1 Tax=Reinekea blandensis MED297 TaxID=314283 RepID=A4BC91_9GAMM|nr:trypsin-like peptidase domain-containing protein [Reinekea blandensis]EAR10157.1 Peptidase S1 and S6, chymotrypsin/Hap [Reinekea sp. MED297] [Reinekea blandensis MED297]
MLTQRTRDWLLPIVVGIFAGLVYMLVAEKGPFSPATRSDILLSYSASLAKSLPFAVSIVSRQGDTELAPLIADPLIQKYLQNDVSDRTILGSGILISQQGDVVTNAHVVKGADDIRVVTHEGLIVGVDQVFIDPETDIALLKTRLTTSLATPVSTTEAEIGDVVFSIGNPFGVGQSVSMGIVSAKRRAQPGLTNLTDFIQTDAAINPGNSGGPLVTADGRILGMNSALFSATGGNQGIGFAIPIHDVLSVATMLSELGRIERGYLGIDVRQSPLTNTESSSPQVALKVVSIDPGSPAEQAGLRVGDQLLEINDVPLSSRTQAARLISQLMPGKTTDLRLLREGQPIRLTVELGRRTPTSP